MLDPDVSDATQHCDRGMTIRCSTSSVGIDLVRCRCMLTPPEPPQDGSELSEVMKMLKAKVYGRPNSITASGCVHLAFKTATRARRCAEQLSQFLKENSVSACHSSSVRRRPSDFGGYIATPTATSGGSTLHSSRGKRAVRAAQGTRSGPNMNARDQGVALSRKMFAGERSGGIGAVASTLLPQPHPSATATLPGTCHDASATLTGATPVADNWWTGEATVKQRTDRFEQAAALASSPLKPTVTPGGLANTGNSCYFNAVISALLHCPPVTRAVACPVVESELAAAWLRGALEPSSMSPLPVPAMRAEQCTLGSSGVDASEAAAPAVRLLRLLREPPPPASAQVASSATTQAETHMPVTRFLRALALQRVVEGERLAKHDEAYEAWHSTLRRAAHRPTAPSQASLAAADPPKSKPRAPTVSCITPLSLRGAINAAIPHFANRQQQDAHEFLVGLLDALDQEAQRAAPGCVILQAACTLGVTTMPPRLPPTTTLRLRDDVTEDFDTALCSAASSRPASTRASRRRRAAASPTGELPADVVSKHRTQLGIVPANAPRAVAGTATAAAKTQHYATTQGAGNGHGYCHTSVAEWMAAGLERFRFSRRCILHDAETALVCKECGHRRIKTQSSPFLSLALITEEERLAMAPWTDPQFAETESESEGESQVRPGSSASSSSPPTGSLAPHTLAPTATQSHTVQQDTEQEEGKEEEEEEEEEQEVRVPSRPKRSRSVAASAPTGLSGSIITTPNGFGKVNESESRGLQSLRFLTHSGAALQQRKRSSPASPANVSCCSGRLTSTLSPEPKATVSLDGSDDDDVLEASAGSQRGAASSPNAAARPGAPGQALRGHLKRFRGRSWPSPRPAPLTPLDLQQLVDAAVAPPPSTRPVSCGHNGCQAMRAAVVDRLVSAPAVLPLQLQRFVVLPCEPGTAGEGEFNISKLERPVRLQLRVSIAVHPAEPRGNCVDTGAPQAVEDTPGFEAALRADQAAWASVQGGAAAGQGRVSGASGFDDAASDDSDDAAGAASPLLPGVPESVKQRALEALTLAKSASVSERPELSRKEAIGQAMVALRQSLSSSHIDALSRCKVKFVVAAILARRVPRIVGLKRLRDVFHMMAHDLLPLGRPMDELTGIEQYFQEDAKGPEQQESLSLLLMSKEDEQQRQTEEDKAEIGLACKPWSHSMVSDDAPAIMAAALGTPLDGLLAIPSGGLEPTEEPEPAPATAATPAATTRRVAGSVSRSASAIETSPSQAPATSAELVPGPQRIWYELHAMVLHSGFSPHSGHYTAVVRGRPTMSQGVTKAGADWWHYNDENVRRLSEAQVFSRAMHSQTCYMLFYVRCDDEQVQPSNQNTGVVAKEDDDEGSCLDEVIELE